MANFLVQRRPVEYEARSTNPYEHSFPPLLRSPFVSSKTSEFPATSRKSDQLAGILGSSWPLGLVFPPVNCALSLYILLL
jgi:hypothetical protein